MKFLMLYRFVNVNNITMNSVYAGSISSVSWIELGGISYYTTYLFNGLYANDVNLGKPYICKLDYRINISF